ncbi:hypothetical protein E2562_027201 [Oryza meyeriana var. granulata]|uniref:Uncharacterized protein n=1 Tax=Oryza meyeriana var. granulata TaxID=110450 RepID=A0A6G1EZG5_9ORYZ|nr:hypothetical protein E2562_027201 [Oryza meyeriana var. granulata]
MARRKVEVESRRGRLRAEAQPSDAAWLSAPRAALVQINGRVGAVSGAAGGSETTPRPRRQAVRVGRPRGQLPPALANPHVTRPFLPCAGR